MLPFPSSRRILLGISALIFAIALLVAGKPAYRALKTWRAIRLLANAEQHVAKGEWHDAYQSLHAATTLAPGDSSITRTTARLLGEHGDPQALAFLETLVQSPDGTPQDRIDLIRTALQLGQLTAVQKHLMALLGEPQTAHRFDVLFLAADWHGRCGDPSRAVTFARQALALAADSGQAAEAELLLARSLLQSPSQTPRNADGPPQDEARKCLWEIASREDRTGLAALLMLGEVCKVAASPDETRQLGALLGRHPLAGDEQRLLGLTWKLRAEPDRREPILTDTIAMAHDATPARLAAVGSWLIQQHESRRALALIPLASARQDRDLFLIYVDALADLGQWQDLQVLLAGKAPLPVEPTIRNVFKARTALALGHEEESRQHWQDVRQTMRNAEPKTILYVAQYAERLGRRDDAAKAYRLLTATTGVERAGFMGLLHLAEQSGDTRTLRDQLKEFAERFPNDFEVQNDLAYLDLLLGEHVASSLQAAEQLVNRFPEILACRTTLALALLRNRDAAAAGRVYRGIATDWSAAKPGWHAVYAAVLAATGEQTLATTHAREIDGARLKPEERALIAGLERLSAR